MEIYSEVKMAQLTIYLDQLMIKQLQSAAKREHSSVSHWVKTKLASVLHDSWPTDYFSLFGALGDDDLQRPKELDGNLDVRRESL
jgi:hypothetical protein